MREQRLSQGIEFRGDVPQWASVLKKNVNVDFVSQQCSGAKTCGCYGETCKIERHVDPEHSSVPSTRSPVAVAFTRKRSALRFERTLKSC